MASNVSVGASSDAAAAVSMSGGRTCVGMLCVLTLAAALVGELGKGPKSDKAAAGGDSSS